MFKKSFSRGSGSGNSKFSGRFARLASAEAKPAQPSANSSHSTHSARSEHTSSNSARPARFEHSARPARSEYSARPAHSYRSASQGEASSQGQSSEARPARSFVGSGSARPFARSSEGSSRSFAGSSSLRPYRDSGSSRPYGRSSGSSSSRSSSSRAFGGGRNSKAKKVLGRAFERIDAARFVKKSEIVEKAPEFVAKNKFADFPFDPKIKANIVKKGYVQPTPIQDESIPHILEQKDLVGIANTGTGKTAAFLLPLLHKIINNRTQKVLIVAPTRELALQINAEFVSFAIGTGLYSVACIGGSSIGIQISSLRKPTNFVIGTPGRIKDLITRKVLNLSQFQNVVIDEADRMLDMGFLPDMNFIMHLLPKIRQSLFFSATISPEINKLIQTFLLNPITVSVKMQETAANVEQDVVKIPRNRNKLDVLDELLRQQQFEKVLIFGRTKRGVERLTGSLVQKGFQVASIHGDKTQSGRQVALNLFKNNKVKILVATDVVARGLDIPNVSHVINFDLPATYDDYVHRIGRTGRAEQKGIALTFVDA